MAVHKDKFSMQRLFVIKAARSAIRLKHTLAADAEINERLPEIEREFDKAISQGKAFKLDTFALFKDI